MNIYDKTFGNILYYNLIAEFMKKNIIDVYKINTFVDLACGTGTLIKVLNDFSVECIGVDISKEQLKEAKRKNRNSVFYNEDINKLYFNKKFIKGKDAIFHLGYCFLNVLNRSDRLKILSNIYKIKNCKYFIFEVWNTKEQEKIYELNKEYSMLLNSNIILKSKSHLLYSTKYEDTLEIDFNFLINSQNENYTRIMHRFHENFFLDDLNTSGWEVIKKITPTYRKENKKGYYLYVCTKRY